MSDESLTILQYMDVVNVIFINLIDALTFLQTNTEKCGPNG